MPTEQPDLDAYFVRWMVRKDMPYVLDAEDLAFGGEHDKKWNEHDYRYHLMKRNVIGVASATYRNDSVAAFMLYELHQRHFNILRLLVHSNHRGQGHATRLLERLTAKLRKDQRTSITFLVPAYATGLQFLLAHAGWQGTADTRYKQFNEILFRYDLSIASQ